MAGLSNRSSQNISIHALREEGDAEMMHWLKGEAQFLSTPSARRATRTAGFCASRPAYFYPRPPRGGRRNVSIKHIRNSNFYPRPPRGGRPSATAHHCKQRFISIHALREEGDGTGCRPVMSRLRFLSTPSARRATLS